MLFSALARRPPAAGPSVAALSAPTLQLRVTPVDYFAYFMPGSPLTIMFLSADIVL